MQQTAESPNSIKQSKLPLYISILLLGGLIASYFLIPEVKYFCNEAWEVLTSDDQSRIEQWVKQFGWWGPAVIIITMLVQMILFVLPSVALMVVTILAYGPMWGSLLVLLSIFIASSAAYAIGNYFGPVIIEKLIGKKSKKKTAQFIEDYGFWAVVITRINPFLSNDAISFVAGILKMSYGKFIGATLLGITPLTILIAIMGKSTDSLKTGLFWGSLVSLIIFGLYIYWDKKKRKKD